MEAGVDQRLCRRQDPPFSILGKAELWTGPQFELVRKILQSPMIVVDISSDEHAVKVDVRDGDTSITIIPSSGSLPSTMADITIGLFVIDVRSMSHEEGGLLGNIPGRSKLVDCPVVIIGGAAEVEEARKAIVRASGNQWSGQLRSMFILTSDTNSQYSCSSKRLLIMIPPGPAVPKLPPMANLTGYPNMTLSHRVAGALVVRPRWLCPGRPQGDLGVCHQ